MSEELSDLEIRRRLKEYGYDAPPITGATRAVLLKKLKSYEGTFNSSQLAHLSSADEEDIRVVSSQSQRVLRRRTRYSTEPESQPSTPAAPKQASSRLARVSHVQNEEQGAKRNKYDPKYIPTPPPAPKKNRSHNITNEPSIADSRESIWQNASPPSAPAKRLVDLRDRLDGGIATSTPISSTENHFRAYSSLPGPGNRQKRRNVFKALLDSMDAPSWILLVFIIFFIGLFTTYYYNNHYVYQGTGLTDLSHLECTGSSRIGVDCIQRYGIQATESILESVYKDLKEAAMKAYCNDAPEQALVRNNEIYQHMVHTLRYWDKEADAALDGIKLVARMYPNLSIVVENEGLRLKDPVVPWMCSWRRNVHVFLTSVARLVGAAVMTFVVIFAFKWVKRIRDSKRKELQQLIHSIIEMLQKNAAQNPELDYLPISYVHSHLISPQDRKTKQKLWDEAVKLIETGESRIRKQVLPYNGEDYLVWKWLPQEQNAPKRKTWQGEAFMTTKGAINSPNISLTQCLKIRHMFDPATEDDGSDWMTVVKDAILERCEDAKIVHIAVDNSNSEGCIYVKCASTEDAGIVFRKIHGAWFDGKIVTAKYIRTERYHEHYPESALLTVPLKPSNNLRRSLQG